MPHVRDDAGDFMVTGDEEALPPRVHGLPTIFIHDDASDFMHMEDCGIVVHWTESTDQAGYAASQGDPGDRAGSGPGNAQHTEAIGEFCEHMRQARPCDIVQELNGNNGSADGIPLVDGPLRQFPLPVIDPNAVASP